jgi:hypothetical protein
MLPPVRRALAREIGGCSARAAGVTQRLEIRLRRHCRRSCEDGFLIEFWKEGERVAYPYKSGDAIKILKGAGFMPTEEGSGAKE